MVPDPASLSVSRWLASRRAHDTPPARLSTRPRPALPGRDRPRRHEHAAEPAEAVRQQVGELVDLARQVLGLERLEAQRLAERRQRLFRARPHDGEVPAALGWREQARDHVAERGDRGRDRPGGGQQGAGQRIDREVGDQDAVGHRRRAHDDGRWGRRRDRLWRIGLVVGRAVDGRDRGDGRAQLAQHPGGDAAGDDTGRDGPVDDAAGRHHGSGTDAGARQDGDAAGDPGAVLDDDGRRGRRVGVDGTGDAVGEDAVRADADLVADGDLAGHVEQRGEVDRRAGPDRQAGAGRRAELDAPELTRQPGPRAQLDAALVVDHGAAGRHPRPTADHVAVAQEGPAAQDVVPDPGLVDGGAEP